MRRGELWDLAGEEEVDSVIDSGVAWQSVHDPETKVVNLHVDNHQSV